MTNIIMILWLMSIFILVIVLEKKEKGLFFKLGVIKTRLEIEKKRNEKLRKEVKDLEELLNN